MDIKGYLQVKYAFSFILLRQILYFQSARFSVLRYGMSRFESFLSHGLRGRGKVTFSFKRLTVIEFEVCWFVFPLAVQAV